MILFTSHNQEAHRQWFDRVVSICGFHKKTQLVFRAFLYEYENRVRIMGEDRGYWFNSLNQIAKDIGAEYITIRTIFDALKSANIITSKSANGGTKITINEFEMLYGIQNPKSANKSASKVATKSANDPQQNRMEEGKREETLTPLSADADLFGKLEKVEEKPEPKARAKKVSTVDPQINPTPILEEIQKSGVVVDFGKDGRLLKSIMTSRQQAGVKDVPAEVREMWARFKSVSLNGRGHNVGTFKYQYDHLVEHFVRPVNFEQQTEPHIPSKNPYTRWAQIKEYYPNALKDPDQGYPFSLTDEAVQAQANPFKPISLQGRRK